MDKTTNDEHVDKTTQNDAALADNQSDNERDEDSTAEGDGASERESTQSDADTVTLTKAERDQLIADTRKEQDQRWKKRYKEAGIVFDEDGEEGGKSDTQSTPKADASDERYDRLELKTEGVTDKAQQDIVIEYARFKGISVMDAYNSSAVKAELKELRDKSSTPPPSRRTGGRNTDSVEYWADQLKRNGKTAPSAEMRTKVRQHLASQE